MKIQAVLDLAKESEVSTLAVKKSPEVLLSYLNLGMIELYKRFPLLVKEYVVDLTDGAEIYTMPSDFMWLTAAYDEVPENSSETVRLATINDEDDPLSINTVSWNQVQIPLHRSGSAVSLIYQASPPYYLTTELTTDIALPVQLTEALLHYIGYRAHAATDGSIEAENNTHYQRFEKSCQMVTIQGMFTGDSIDMSKRLSTRGFV